MKKFLAIALIAVSFAACNEGEKKAEETTPAATETPAAETPAATETPAAAPATTDTSAAAAPAAAPAADTTKK